MYALADKAIAHSHTPLNRVYTDSQNGKTEYMRTFSKILSIAFSLSFSLSFSIFTSEHCMRYELGEFLWPVEYSIIEYVCVSNECICERANIQTSELPS